MNQTAGLTLHLKSQEKCPVNGVHLALTIKAINR